MEFRDLLQQEFMYERDDLIDVEKLDYSYVKTCQNPQELAAILRVLKSGREGCYPDLEDFTERRLKQVVEENSTRTSYGGKSNKNIVKLEEFISSTKKKNNIVEDEALKAELDAWSSSMANQKSAGEEELLSTTPVRTFNSEADSKGKGKLEEISEKIIELPATATASIFNSEASKLNQLLLDDINLKLSNCKDQETLKRLAETEKQKGNESVKCQGFNEAIHYYTISLLLYPQSHVWSNRSLAHYKLKLYREAVEDATEAISLDPDNRKAYIRRGNAQYQLGEYELAVEDLEKSEFYETDEQVKKLLEQARIKSGVPGQDETEAMTRLCIVENSHS